MVEINVISKESHNILEKSTADAVIVSEPSVVLAKVNVDDVRLISREGNNIVVTLKNSEKIVIINFFVNDNSLVFEDTNHKLLWVQFTDNNPEGIIENLTYGYIDSVEPLLYDDSYASPWAWLSVPVTTGGILWWANSGDHDQSDKDITAPEAPIVDPVNGKDPITGQAEAGSEVTVTYPDGSTATATVGEDGNWTVPNPGLEDGDEVKVTAKDPSGNESPETKVAVDAVAPEAPVVDPVNGKDPITGTAEPGSEVTVTYPDGSTATATVGEDGNWTVPNPGLEDGDEVKVTAKDPSGNESPETKVAVDAVAPEAPVVDPVNGKDPITGQAEAGSEVTVTYPDGSTATATVGEDGNWTVPNPGLEDGDEVKVTAKDPSGNESPETKVAVDAVAPEAPVVDPVNGKDPITGTAEAGSEVTVTYPDGSTVTATVGEDGNWTVPNPGLEDGDEVKVTAKDPSGNESPETKVAVDAVAPEAPVVDPVNGKDPITGTAEPGSEVTVKYPDGSTETVVADTEDGSWTVPNPGLEDGDEVKVTAKDPSGNESPETKVAVDAIAPIATVTDKITNDNMPELTGTVDDAMATVVVTVDGVSYVAVNNGDGTWTLADNIISKLYDGTYDLTVTAVDLLGNASTNTGVLNVDTVAPFIILNQVDVVSPVGGVAEPGSKVTVTYPDGSTVTTTAGADGLWSFFNPGNLIAGGIVSATATDAAGNTSTPVSDNISVIDITAPTPTFSSLITNDSTPALTGTVDDAMATVVVTVDGVSYAAVNNGDGTWTLADNSLPALTDGAHAVSVTATDAAGNQGTATGNLMVDTVAPTVSLNPINEHDPITGTAEPGSEVTVTYPDGSTVTATVGEDGNWAVPNPGLNEGDTVTAVATDLAGNDSTPATATVDGTAPSVSVDDLITNDSTPALTGTVDDAMATVVVTVDGVSYAAVNNGNGTWTLADNSLPALTDGAHAVSVTATDAAGNQGTATGNLMVDTVAPTVSLNPINEHDPITGTAEPGSEVTVTYPDGSTVTATVGEDGNWAVPNPGLNEGDTVTAVATDLAGNDSTPATATVDGTAPSVSVDDLITNDSTPALTGTVDDAMATVVVTVDGVSYAAVNNGDGTWTLADNSLPALTDGAHAVSVTATDAAGNQGTATGNLMVDTVAPTVSLNPINEHDPITGTAEPGSEVTVTYPDGSTVTATVGEDGNWAVPNPGLNEGDTVTAVATDLAGNDSTPATATVDGTAPSVSVDDLITNDSTPALTGTVDDAMATVVVTVDGVSYAAVNNGNGTWTLADNSLPALTDGAHAVSVTATDAAGNQGTATGNLMVDTVAPTVSLNPINEHDPITGTAEPGSEVTVTYPDGSTVTATVGEDGNWAVPNPGLNEGDTVTAVATDLAGNDSTPATATVDGTAPSVSVDDLITNDSTPALTGTVDDAMATVVVTVDGVSYAAVNNGNGTWTLADNSLPALTDGAHAVSVTATDAAGNQGTATGNLMVDTVAPTVSLNPINEHDPITGTAEPGSEVTVTYPDGSTVTATVGEDGNWAVPNPGLNEGDTVTAVATDLAGNDSTPATATVDGTAPSVSVDDLITNDSTPALTGTVDDAMATVVVTVDGVSYAAVNNGDGTWTLADNSLPALTDGAHAVSVTATDAAGNQGTATGNLMVDTVAPTVSLNPINEHDPITGTAEPGSEVTVTYPDGSTVTATVGEDGNWAVPNPGLNEGDTVTAVATDLAGNDSTPATATVDGTAPSVSVDDLITNDSTPALTGTVDDAMATVVVTVDGVSYAAVNNGNGTWTLADNSLPALTDGAHAVSVTATDAAGNQGTATGNLMVDTVAPTVSLNPINEHDPITGTAEPGSEVTVTYPDGSTVTATVGEDGNWAVPNPGLNEGDTVTAVATDLAGNDSTPATATVDGTAPSVSVDDLITNDSTPALTGTVDDAMATVVVTVDGVSYAAVNNGDGTWTLADNSLPALTDGAHAVSVTATDAAGNQGTATGNLMVDTVAPTVSLNPINEHDPITGTAEPGSEVTVTYPDGSTVTATVGEDGNWAVPNPGLNEGDTVTAVATDLAGNDSTPATATVDGTAPSVSVDDLITNDSTPALTGTVDDAMATVVVTVDGVSYAAVNNGNGTWTLADNSLPALTDGAHAVSVTATDAAGNQGTATGNLMVDTVAPTVSLNPINEHDPITGTAEPGSEVTVTYPDGSTVTATVGEDGNWAVPNPGLNEGDTVTAVATDLAGNDSTPATATVDGTAPSVSVDDLITNDSTPALTGTVDDAMATVVVTVDGVSYAAVNNGDGTWTLADNSLPALTDGAHAVSVTATDAAGNQGTATGNLMVDTVAPTVSLNPINEHDPITGTAEPGSEVTVTYPDGSTVTATVGEDGNWAVPNPGLNEGDTVTAVATDLAGNDSTPATATVDGTAPSVSVDDLITNDSTPALTGTVDDAMATVVVTVDGVSYAAVNNGNGTWTLADNSLPALTDGAHAVSVTATDAAGNQGTATGNLMVDTVAPTVSLNPINEHDPITGTAEPGSEVTVTYPDGSTVTATVGEDGNWAVPNPGLNEGDTVTAVATDLAGNDSTPATATVDGTAPSVSVDDLITNDSTPALTGTVDDAMATVVVTVDGVSYAAVNNGNGTWTLADNSLPALTDGAHAVSVTATDAAGNQGTATGNLMVDTVAPTVTVNSKLTIDSTPALTGTVDDAMATVVVTVDGVSYAAVNNGDGTWILEDDILLVIADGPHDVIAVAVDSAGNEGTAIGTITVDSVTPVVLVYSEVTNDTTPLLHGTVDDPTAKIVVTVGNVSYIAINNGDGTWTLPDNILPPQSNGPHSLFVTATDEAGRMGIGTGTLTIDTYAPSVTVNNQLTNDATPALTGGVSDAQATVIVTVDGVSYTAMNNSNGTWTLADNTVSILADGTHQVTVKAIDKAGNTGNGTGTVTVDTIALKPTITLANDNGLSNTDGITNDGKVNVSGLEPGAIWHYSTDGGMTWNLGTGSNSFTLPEGEYQTDVIQVRQTDKAGNMSPIASLGSVIIDTTEPSVSLDPVGAGAITGTAEPDATVIVSYPGGVTATTVAGGDGNWTVPNPGTLSNGTTVTAVAKDIAGNTSLPAAKIVSIIDALNNVDTAMLNLSYPINTEVLSGAIKYSWLIGALGVVVGQTNGAAIFNTPQGTVTDAVITINSDSLLAAFDSVHLVLTRIEPDGTRTIIGNSSSVGFFDVLGIFGQSAQIQVKNLLPGKYELFMENSNLATLPGMVSVDITLKEHDITLPLVASTTAISGNVITDNDSALYGVAYGKDVVTTATVVTNIVSETGTSAAVITGFKTVIEGAYGTLTINANGSFSYLANTEAANIGKVDSFSYIISDPIGGGTDTAQLHIQINGSDVTLNWNNSDPSLDAGIFSPLANADSNTATIAVTNVVDPTIAGPSASDSWLVSILSENRILSAPFTVAVGTEADIHVNLSSGSLLSFLSSTTMNFQKLAADGITWVTLDTVTAGSLADLIGLFGAGATGIYNNVQEGTYRFQLNYSTGKGIAGSISLDTEITTTHLADYKLDISDTNWIHGNILTGDTAGGVADILLGSKLYVQNEVTNQYELAVGQHINTGEGTLVIQSDGSYDYQPTVFSANTDVISYKLVSVTGDESVSNLTIGIGHKFNLQDGNEFVTSTSGNDLINSSAGGSDTLIFSVLNSVDATGGNGIDTWNNFHVGNTVTDVKADQIDVSTLLYGVNSSNISGFVSLTYDGKGTAVLSIDRDGLGDTFTSSSELLTLHLDTKPANLTLQDLINNNQLLF